MTDSIDMVSTVESEFIPNALLKGFRIDGRGLNDMRKIKIALGPPLGFAQIQLGKTRYDDYSYSYSYY